MSSISANIVENCSPRKLSRDLTKPVLNLECLLWSMSWGPVQSVSNRHSVYMCIRLPPTSVNPVCEPSVWPNGHVTHIVRPKTALRLRLLLAIRFEGFNIGVGIIWHGWWWGWLECHMILVRKEDEGSWDVEGRMSEWFFWTRVVLLSGSSTRQLCNYTIIHRLAHACLSLTSSN